MVWIEFHHISIIMHQIIYSYIYIGYLIIVYDMVLYHHNGSEPLYVLCIKMLINHILNHIAQLVSHQSSLDYWNDYYIQIYIINYQYIYISSNKDLGVVMDVITIYSVSEWQLINQYTDTIHPPYNPPYMINTIK